MLRARQTITQRPWVLRRNSPRVGNSGTPVPVPRNPCSASFFSLSIPSEDPSSGIPGYRAARSRRGPVRAGELHGRRCACARASALRMREDGRPRSLSSSAVTVVPSVPKCIGGRVGPRLSVGGAEVLRRWGGRPGAAPKGAAEPESRAPRRPGRREGAWGARGAGQHESAAAGAETAQPAGGSSTGDGTTPLPGPHQRGEPTGERGPGPPGVTCCGARSLRPALCTLVAWLPRGSSCSSPSSDRPLLFTYFYCIYLLCGWASGAWNPRGNLGKSVLCFHLCGSQDGTQVEFVKLGGKCLPELSDLARPSVLFDRGNERAAIPSISGFPRFSGPLLGPSFVHFSCSLFSPQDKQYPSGSGQSRASYFMSTVCSH